MAKKDIDITKTGPLGFRQLLELNNLMSEGLSPEFLLKRERDLEQYAPISTFDMDQHMTEPVRTNLPEDNLWGESVYDEKNANELELDYLGNTRAINQSALAQVTNGLTKGTLLAGTTFLDGTAGLLFGAAAAINDNDISSIWNNEFSKTLKGVNEWAETQIPNYYSNKELESPWYNNILTANFIGDKFIKNLGFTIGAYYSGKAFAAAFQATKLPQLMGVLTKSTSAPGHVVSGVGAAISSVNEGRIEALNNAMDVEAYKKAVLDDKYAERLQGLEAYKNTEMYNSMVLGINIEYELDLQKLHENSLKMGNADLLMNIGILFGPNILQFGKLYAGGASTAIRSRNIVGKLGKYATGRSTKKGVLRAALNPLSEGMEEISQEAASNIAGTYYGNKFDNFYEGRINPQAEQLTIDWLKATALGINETVNDGNAWEQFFIGTLTGAMGMPQFRSTRSADGKFRSPVTIEGGFKGELSDYNEDMKSDIELAEAMNKRMLDKNFLNYYQGLIRHHKYLNEMDAAAEDGNIFDYKDAEHSQMISDINMFSNAGKLGDYTTYIGTAYDTSDENLQSIVQNTTRVVEVNGEKKTVGRFVDEKGNSLLDTEEGKDKMIKDLTKSKEQIENKIKDYNDVKRQVLRQVGLELEPAQLEELIWLKSKILDWKLRALTITGEIQPLLRDVLADYKETLEVTNLSEEHFGSNEDTRGLFALNMTTAIDILEKIANTFDEKAASRLLSRDKNLSDYLQTVVDNAFSDDIVDKKDLIEKLNDVYKTGLAREAYQAKVDEFLNNPATIIDAILKVVEDTEQEIKESKYKDLLDKLDKVLHLGDIVDILDNVQYTEKEIDEIIKESKNPIVKEYYKVKQYKDKLTNYINDNVKKLDTKELANSIVTYNIKETGKFKDLNNPYELDSSYLDKFYDNSKSAEDNEALFIEALYAVIKAMHDISKDEAYKNKFNTEFIKSVDDIIAELNKKKDALQNDSDIKHNPPAKITILDDNLISLENEEANDNEDKTVLNNSNYYRPIIPYYQQDAVKNKDFRKFVEVMADKGMDFKPIFNYLEENGAFSYINDGKLKVGDKVGFMIDPSFDENTIFMIDSKNGQVIGSLPSAKSKVSEFTGMPELQLRIKELYFQREKSSAKFIATDTTNVSKIMLGKIETSDTLRSLKDIPNVTANTILGIVKNGRLLTNGKLNSSDITNLKDISNKEGRVYMLIPNARGLYSPMAIRTARYNSSTISGQTLELLNDNKPLLEVQDLIASLARVTSLEDVTSIMNKLSQLLYLTGIYVDYQSGNTGSFLRISQYLYDENGSPIYKKVKGLQVHADKTTAIFLDLAAKKLGYFDENNKWQKNTDDSAPDYTPLINLIDTIFQSFNRTMQVNLGMLNKQGYNQALLNSGILSSNVANAQMQGSWFTTDYLDAKGKLYKADTNFKPVSDTTNPLGGDESIVKGTNITVHGKDYIVDLNNKKVFSTKGTGEVLSLTKELTAIIFDLTRALITFGDRMHSNNMIDGKLLLANDKVLDRINLKYLNKLETIAFKKQLNDKKTNTAKSLDIVKKLYEDLKKVDKDKTDSEFYYVLEEDGVYYPYSRVHTVLGNNWIEDLNITSKIDAINKGLKNNSVSIVKLDKYLDELSAQYKIDLSGFKGDTSTQNINNIKVALGDLIRNTQSRRALDAGSSIDSIIRDFFTNKTTNRPSNISEKAYKTLIDSLTAIKNELNKRGEVFLTNNLVLHHKYTNGARIAGEVDILAVDKQGNFKIYDVKTSKYSFSASTNRSGRVIDYFRNRGDKLNRSTFEQYTLLLSAYKNLFEAAYGGEVIALALLPYQLSYSNDSGKSNIVDTLTPEAGIPIQYNKDIEGKIASMKDNNKDNNDNVQPTPTPTPAIELVDNNEVLKTLFNADLELFNPVDDTTDHNKLDNYKTGYYLDADNKLRKGPIAYLGTISGIPLHIRQTVTMSNGGNAARALFPALKSFDVIFPNGNTLTVVRDISYSSPTDEAYSVILKALRGNPSRLLSEAANQGLNNLLQTKGSPEVDSNKIEDTSQIDNIPEETTVDNSENDDNLSPSAINDKFNKVDNNISDVFEEDDLELRAVEESMPKEEFSLEKELAWLDKVLPLLSKEDRVKVVEDLGKIGDTKVLGAFVRGTILLNTQANNSKGTTYHEAFHAVISLILNTQEKQTLFNEATSKFGDLNDKLLEEKLAEEFRLYTLNYVNRNLGTKILDFFKRLFNITSNWNNLGPNTTRIFYNINNLKYSQRTLNANVEVKESNNKVTLDNLSKETRDSLIAQGWTDEMWNKISLEEQEQAKYCS